MESSKSVAKLEQQNHILEPSILDYKLIDNFLEKTVKCREQLSYSCFLVLLRVYYMVNTLQNGSLIIMVNAAAANQDSD